MVTMLPSATAPLPEISADEPLRIIVLSSVAGGSVGVTGGSVGVTGGSVGVTGGSVG